MFLKTYLMTFSTFSILVLFLTLKTGFSSSVIKEKEFKLKKVAVTECEEYHSFQKERLTNVMCSSLCLSNVNCDAYKYSENVCSIYKGVTSYIDDSKSSVYLKIGNKGSDPSSTVFSSTTPSNKISSTENLKGYTKHEHGDRWSKITRNENDLTWKEAQKECENDGGEFFIVKNLDDGTFLFNETQEHFQDGFWIGLLQDPDGNIKWIDGSSWNGTNFPPEAHVTLRINRNNDRDRDRGGDRPPHLTEELLMERLTSILTIKNFK